MNIEAETSIPDCIEAKIEYIKNEDVRNPPAKVWKWKMNDKIYYYFTSDCCDQYNELLDENCNYVCAPDGGVSGEGDGSCPDLNTPIEKTLIWEDNRK